MFCPFGIASAYKFVSSDEAVEDSSSANLIGKANSEHYATSTFRQKSAWVWSHKGQNVSGAAYFAHCDSNTFWPRNRWSRLLNIGSLNFSARHVWAESSRVLQKRHSRALQFSFLPQLQAVFENVVYNNDGRHLRSRSKRIRSSNRDVRSHQREQKYFSSRCDHKLTKNTHRRPQLIISTSNNCKFVSSVHNLKHHSTYVV